MTNNQSQTGQTPETLAAQERAEETRILDEIKSADGKSAEFSHSAKIAQKLEKGELDLTREERMKLRDTLKDKNKMKGKPYEHFMEALADGKFPRKGKNAMRFLEAIEEPDEKEKPKELGEDKVYAGKEEREYASELLKDLAKAENPPLSEKSEMSSLAKLEEMRMAEQAEKFGTKQKGEAEAGKVREKIESTAKVDEKELWKVDRPPEGLIKNLETIELKMFDLMAQSNAKHKKKESTEELDAEIDRLELERLPFRQQYIDYLRRAGERFEAIQKLASRAGMDMEEVSRLIIWSIEHDGSNGAKVDAKTGKVEKKKEALKITRIYFTQEKDEKDAEYPGELKVDYVDERGKTETAGYTNFLKLIDALEIHKDIKTLADLNKEVAKNTRYEGVKEGQVYRTKVLVELTKEGEKVYEDAEFTIEKIDESGKEPVIVLDRNVTKTPLAWLSTSADPALYFKRVQKEYSLGEFAKLIKNNDYSREIKPEELQSFLDRSAKARRERAIEMNEKVAMSLTGKPATEISRKRAMRDFEAPTATSGAVQIPPVGKSSPVDFYDFAAGGKRVLDAKLTVIPDPKTGKSIFEISYADTAENSANLTGLSGIPIEMKRAIGPTFLPQPRIIRREFDQDAFMELADKGAVAHGHEAHGQEEHAPHAEEHHEAPHEEHHEEHGHDEHGHDEHGHEEHGHDEHGHDEHGHDEHGGESEQKYYKEAVTFEEAYKTGLPSEGTTQSHVRNIWNNTRFLSIDDLWKMGKTCYEYYERRFEQRQKNRYGIVGKELPFFGSEMQQISQASNNEQTSHFKEALEKRGIVTIRERLRVTSNKEEFKACILVLIEKGMMIWHDVAFWKNLNKFVKPGKEVPLPPTNNPHTHISVSDPRTGYDFVETGIDSIWGDGFFGEWYSENKNHYDSHAKHFYVEGKELEGVDGGHARKLASLLHHHKAGNFVDPMEYEGLLLHAIEAGKADMEDKIYYLVEGVAAKNGKGETILTLDRMAHVNGEMLGKFPLLEYMCANAPRPPDGAEKSRFTFEDYERWAHWFDAGHDHPGHPNTQPTEAVNEFMWKYALPSENTQNRINKVARSIENVDHDDLYAYIPPATDDVLTDICKTNVGGRKGATIEGYANVFPGFSQYMKSLSQHGYKDKLAEAVKSYVRFEGIMTNKFEKQVDSAHDAFQRMGDKTLNSSTICSSEPPSLFIGEMNQVIRQIANAYGDSDLNSVLSDIQDLQVGDMSDPEEKKKQDRKNYAYHQFGKVFSKVTESDGQAKMLNIMQTAKLTGMGYTPAAEKARRRNERHGEGGGSHH